jgi:polysaccharide export outer membrane protein
MSRTLVAMSKPETMNLPVESGDSVAMAIRWRVGLIGLALLSASGCASSPPARPSPEFRPSGFAQWNETDAAYRLYPGDQFEVVVYSAPELNRTVTIGPDGRAFFPLAGTIMAADRTAAEVRQDLQLRLASQLRTPVIDVAPTTFASQQVFVGGEVARQGVYPLPGQIDALQAVLLAGGMLDTARSQQVVVLRRTPGGRAMLRVVDLRAGLTDARSADPFSLQRFDIVFVPKSSIAEVNVWVRQYLRDLVGFNVGFSYAINEGQTR